MHDSDYGQLFHELQLKVDYLFTKTAPVEFLKQRNLRIILSTDSSMKVIYSVANTFAKSKWVLHRKLFMRLTHLISCVVYYMVGIFQTAARKRNTNLAGSRTNGGKSKKKSHIFHCGKSASCL